MFFECHRLFALLFDIEENGNVGSGNGEGFGCFEFSKTRVKVKLFMSMYWCSPLRETAVCVFISANI